MEQGIETWLHQLGGSPTTLWTQGQPSADDSKIDSAINWVLEHFRRRSRTSSPTKNDAERSLYSTPPRLHIYDKEVLNVLLKIARRHLAPTFEIFAGYTANNDTSHELCLAMAAIGALFLGVECGHILAKTLYNDARRLHFESFHSRGSRSSFRAASDSVKTFILLAIYGICSGDKRGYEFVEAFHVSMVQAMKSCIQAVSSKPQPAERRELSLISEALDITESYHVLLLQRPPYFMPVSLREELTSCLKIDLTALLDASAGTTNVLGNLREVANLGSLTWIVSSRGETQSRESQLWRPEFIELGLERWVNAKASSLAPSDLPSILLYHLSHLHLQFNVNLLQISARSFVRLAETAQEEEIQKILQESIGSRRFDAAVWHAKAMLQLVQQSLGLSNRDRPQVADQKRILEPPHLPYCIYFSTLIAWYGEYRTSGIRSLARDACIRRGINILAMLKVRVARVLIHALRELLPDEHFEHHPTVESIPARS